ncbi:MAG: hypothetical protein C4589_08060 [Peptococcaceae bacterium]|nr:MAG: hypothetical protein C4589_08060 [Peptococcaceae bacterium]
MHSGYIAGLRAYIQQKEAAGRPVRMYQLPTESAELTAGLPVRVGPEVGSGIVFKEDTAVELGDPSAGSAHFLLHTRRRDLVADGRITLIGPCLREAREGSLPFGQVLLAGGEDLEEKHRRELQRIQLSSLDIEGYMVRSTPRRLWSRVSRAALEHGFSFNVLGGILIAACRAKVSPGLAVEILFVTSNRADVAELEAVGSAVLAAEEAGRRANGDAAGSREDCAGENCDQCEDQDVCDNIKGVLVLRRRKKRKEGEIT